MVLRPRFPKHQTNMLGDIGDVVPKKGGVVDIFVHLGSGLAGEIPEQAMGV